MDYGYIYNLSFSPVYPCVWEGARDSSSNNAVSSLINGLIAAGFPPRGYTAPIPKVSVLDSSKNIWDAEFNGDVKKALMDWQRSRSLPVDGVAGPDVWHALLGASTVTRNCPKCAGNFIYGTTAPTDCKSNLPEEKKNQEETKRAWLPWAIGGAALLSASVLGIYFYQKRRGA